MRERKFNVKLLWPIAVGILLVAFITTLIVTSHHVNDLEHAKIVDTSADTISYLEEVESVETEDIDKYIAYALAYSYGEHDKDILSSNEIKAIIEDHFNVELKAEDIDGIGITPFLMDRHIYFVPEEQKYTLNASDITQSMIANIPVIKYELQDISKSSGKYYVTYEKYIVDNPYEVLNYYADKATKAVEEGKEVSNQNDGIYDYLTAKGKVKSVKNAINSENIDAVGRRDGKIKVTYIVKNDKLLVDKIEKVE